MPFTKLRNKIGKNTTIIIQQGASRLVAKEAEVVRAKKTDRLAKGIARSVKKSVKNSPHANTPVFTAPANPSVTGLPSTSTDANTATNAPTHASAGAVAKPSANSSANPPTTSRTDATHKSTIPHSLSSLRTATLVHRYARPKLKPNSRAREDLINAESALGSTIFGPIPAGHRREFFHDQSNVWIWHESWLDAASRHHQLTIRYEVREDGVFKKVSAGAYFKLAGAELENFRRATHVYLDLIKRHIYHKV